MKKLLLNKNNLMRYFIIIIVFFSSNICLSQELNLNAPPSSFYANSQWTSGYNNIYYIDLNWGGQKPDNYFGITHAILSRFRDVGFSYYKYPADGDLSGIPPEVMYYACRSLFLQVLVTPTQLNIKFFNCKNKVVYTASASLPKRSTDWTSTYQSVINNKIFKTNNLPRHKFDSNLTPEISYPVLEVTDESEETMRSYFESNIIDPIEGIYKNVPDPTDPGFVMKIGIKKYGNIYKGIVLEKMPWSKFKLGEIKFTLEKSVSDEAFSSTFYIGNKSKNENFASFKNNAILKFILQLP
nr:hypothetical protein [Pelagibacterales bacterium]